MNYSCISGDAETFSFPHHDSHVTGRWTPCGDSSLMTGSDVLQIQAGATVKTDEVNLESLTELPMLPKSLSESVNLAPTAAVERSLVDSLRGTGSKGVFDRLGQLVMVMQQASSSRDFARLIARTAREMVNLDRVAVLKKEPTKWEPVAIDEVSSHSRSSSFHPSQRLLKQLTANRRTFWGLPPDNLESMKYLAEAVTAPILDSNGEVIGALYGERQTMRNQPIDQFDAKMVELMACGVAGGWAREKHEQVADARRLLLEHSLTKEIADRLEQDPQLLDGRETEVTMLFCDIAGFSRISEQLSPSMTFEWINEVMETLSKCVRATKGTLVDYVGDELIAMWGAPISMPHHAEAGAKTAIMMLDSLRELNARFNLPGGESTQVGIGLNSGTVRVGNTGSALKMKYGPLGSQVNIASRVQGATRYLRTPALITGETARQLDERFFTRRLCSVRLKNIQNPVELYELAANAGPSWQHLSTDYESALTAWEQGQLQTTIEMLSQVVSKVSHDGPSMVLLSRAVDAWSRDLRTYDPIWTLPSK